MFLFRVCDDELLHFLLFGPKMKCSYRLPIGNPQLSLSDSQFYLICFLIPLKFMQLISRERLAL